VSSTRFQVYHEHTVNVSLCLSTLVLVMKHYCCGLIKREWTSHRDYDIRQEARDDIIAYIEMFYNSIRKHSYLGYLSPNDYEKSALVLN
jgi:putative transposase